MLLFIEHFAIAVGAISGVLAATGRRIDLFGVIVLALVSALGGGSLRDVLLGKSPEWVTRSGPIITAALAAIVTFFTARQWAMPRVLLQIADAHGLALFTILGTKKALALGASTLPAIGMGVITGVAGGMVRDILLSEVPMVFRKEEHLYATAAFIGAGLYTALSGFRIVSEPASDLICIGFILALRLISIKWRLGLPEFR